MSHNAIISEALRRPIQNGSPFSALIKSTACKTFDYGNGKNNTIEGVEFMSDLIDKTSHHVKKLAKKLQKSTLKKSVASVHNFLTTYIQYEADARLQRLRSPGCSWKVRKTGIDCKSFTIFAVSLMREMGYKSIIRQVKQPSFYPEQFTHVYAIVPINQNINSINQLDKYFVLDATVLDNKEVVFIEKKDKLMDGLPYQGMMSPARNSASETTETKNFERSFNEFQKIGFSRSDLTAMKEYMKQLQAVKQSAAKVFMLPRPNGILITDAGENGFVFKPSNFEKYQQVFQSLLNQRGLNSPLAIVGGVQGIGGLLEGGNIGDIFGDVLGGINGIFGGLFGSNRGWYKPEYVKRDGETLQSIVEAHVQDINQSLQQRNMQAVNRAVAELKADLSLVDKTVKAKRAEGWNTPTMDNLSSLIKITTEVKNSINQTLNQWLSAYFNKTGTNGNLSKDSSQIEGQFKEPRSVYVRPTVSVTEQIPNLQIKQGVNIPPLGAGSNTSQIIVRGVQTVNPVNSNNPGNYQTPAQPQNPNQPQTPTTGNFEASTQQASLIPGLDNKYLLVAGGLTVAGLAFYPQIKKMIKA